MRKKMPPRSQIINYWNENYDLIGDTKFGYSEFLENECFACGDVLTIQRCHIGPYLDTKNNDVSNLHLLCGRCHIESEGYSEIGYWTWIKWKRLNEFDLCHSLKRLKMVGINLREVVNNTIINHQINESDLKKITDEISKYFKIKINHKQLLNIINNE